MEAIPYSAAACRTYIAGLKDLTDAAEHHHNQLLRDVEFDEGHLDSVVLARQFRDWRQKHRESLAGMLQAHRKILPEAKRRLAKEYPDLL